MPQARAGFDVGVSWRKRRADMNVQRLELACSVEIFLTRALDITSERFKMQGTDVGQGLTDYSAEGNAAPSVSLRSHALG
jgi:hypothetical protein